MKLFKTFLISTIVFFSACSSGDGSSDEKIANSKWNELGAIGQQFACERYNDIGADKDEESYRRMTSEDNEYKMTPGVARAAVNILQREC